MPKKPTKVSGRFGKLEVIHCNLPPRKRVLVRCNCGKEFAIRSYDLINGRTSSCGSTECSTRSHNLNGKTFGFLNVVSLSQNKNHRNEILWNCQCICGAVIEVKTDNLLNGGVQSCGCKSSELRSQSLLKPELDVLSNTVWNQYKYGASTRGFSFELSQNDVKNLIVKNCYYCGSGLIGEKKISGNRSVMYNGIDRIDSSIGYVLDNCVPCCKICNVAKSDYSVSEFISWAKRLVEYQESI